LSCEYLFELIPSFCRYQTHWVSKDGQRSWDIHPPIPPPHRRCQDDDLNCNSQNNPNTWGSARKDPNVVARSGMKQALASVTNADPSPAERDNSQQHPAATAARLRLQSEEQNQQPLVAAAAVVQPSSRRSVPPLLHAAEHERSRALSNAQIVLPATLLRGNQQLAGTDMFKPSDSSADMRRTGLQHRLADVQRNQDNSGFFESPASVIEE
jgi:hypothetical protein